MKVINQFKSILMIMVLSVSVLSCDNQNSGGGVSFPDVVQDMSVPLSKGYIVDYGVSDSEQGAIFHMNVNLVDDGVSLNPAMTEVSGAGNRVKIDFLSPEDGLVSPGTYSFNAGELVNPFTFHTAFVEANYNYTELTGERHEIVGGTIVVSNDGENYTLIFDCTCNTNMRFVGTYTIPLSYADAYNL